MHAIKSAVTAVALALSACPAFADNSPDAYWYLGGGGGVARHQADPVGSLLGTSPSAAQTRPTGWKLFGGYRLNPFFGVELGYIDFGRISGQGAAPAAGDASVPPADGGDTSGTVGDPSAGSASGTGDSAASDPGTGTDPTAGSDATAVSSNRVLRRNAVSDAGTATVVSHSKGLQLVGVGYLPLNDYFDLFGKFGTFTATTHASLSSIDGTSSDSKTHTDLTWGLGAQVYFNNFLSARVEWEHFRNVGKGVMETAAGTPVDLTSMSLIWNF